MPTQTRTPTHTPTPTTPAWIEVINPEDGYAMMIPGGWQGVAAPQDSDFISSLLAAQSPGLARALEVAINSGLLTHVSFIAVDPDSGATAVVLVGRALPALPVNMLLRGLLGRFGVLEGYSVLDTRHLQVSGVTAALTEFTLDLGEGDISTRQHGLQLFVPARKATFVVILTGSQMQFGDLQPTFEDILNSFRLLS